MISTIQRNGSPKSGPPRDTVAPQQGPDSSLSSALARGELTYHYQPKIDLHDGRVSGVEALLRWVRPDGQVILPDDFVPAAGASGLLQTIMLSLLDRLLTDFAAMQAVQPGLSISFNLTAEDFESDAVLGSCGSGSRTRPSTPTCSRWS